MRALARACFSARVCMCVCLGFFASALYRNQIYQPSPFCFRFSDSARGVMFGWYVSLFVYNQHYSHSFLQFLVCLSVCLSASFCLFFSFYGLVLLFLWVFLCSCLYMSPLFLLSLLCLCLFPLVYRLEITVPVGWALNTNN